MLCMFLLLGMFRLVMYVLLGMFGHTQLAFIAALLKRRINLFSARAYERMFGEGVDPNRSTLETDP
jgi:hypothetical protein